MKAITLHQPWASLVVFGLATIATQTHDRFRCLVGETIAIHAGKRMANTGRIYALLQYFRAKRLSEAGRYQEAETVLDERERELAGPRKYRQTRRLWEGARASDCRPDRP